MRHRRFVLPLAMAPVTAVLVTCSQTLAFTWDEGFHLLAAWLITLGRRPYLDFFFAQPPLNAYWNSLWILIAGNNWRVPHLAASLLAAATVYLAADYVWSRFPEDDWRLPVSLVALVSAGLNVAVVQFAGVAQAYALCLFLLIVAFRCAVSGRAFLSGLAAGAAACSSLLTSAALPVLLGWTLRSAPRKAAFFAAGALAGMLPLAWWFLESPGRVWFEVVAYHSLYRRVEWKDAVQHDLETLFLWVDSAQALSLALLAIVAIAAARRSDLTLSAALAAAIGLTISLARPTFWWYYVLIVPFLAIPAAFGFHALCRRALRPWLALGIYTLLIGLSLARSLWGIRDDFKWGDIEPIARRTAELAAPGAAIYADEHVYFLTGRTPPPGMEYEDSHKLSLPPDQAARLHLIPRAEVSRRIKAGEFPVAQTCENDKTIDKLGLRPAYRRNEVLGVCEVFWEPR